MYLCVIKGKRKEKREKSEFDLVQSESSYSVLDLGLENVSAWGAYAKRLDTPLRFLTSMCLGVMLRRSACFGEKKSFSLSNRRNTSFCIIPRNDSCLCIERGVHGKVP